MNQMELDILGFWEKNNIFQRSVDSRRGSSCFRIYEGPPTANGKPGIHHVLTRTFKDMMARFWTMKGKLVERKAGWDEHGLPVEIEVQKKYALKSRSDIHKFGIDRFNRACAESTQKNIELWEQLTKRMGYWLSFNDAYRTSDPVYIDKVWDVFQTLFKKGLIVQDYKVVPWAWDSETVVSNAEVDQGYQEITSQSIFLRLKASNQNAFDYFSVWTSTPWTVPANMALAVNPDIEYSIFEQKNERYIGTNTFGMPVLARVLGKDLLNATYQHPFSGKECPVLAGGFVTANEGTGIVHIAPAFGQDDYLLAKESGLLENNPIICHVASDGKFNDQAPDFLHGRQVASRTFDGSNSIIISDLKDRECLMGLPVPHKHKYPHNWRTDLPLIYYLRPSFYVKTTQIKEQMLSANQEVSWYPANIKDGRFGSWLETNVDWSISRERFWGTPIPIFSNSESYYFQKPKHHHKPEADEDGRDLGVLDCWFDSGAMPFAAFDEYHQADVICEAVDQTRGWFYSLMALGTALNNEAPYKNVVCLGHVLDEKGQKMSKSKGNVIDPEAIFEEYGADTVRWCMVKNPVGNNLKLSKKAFKAVYNNFTNRLMNTFVFYKTYKDIDQWKFKECEVTRELDSWILSLLNSLIKDVDKNYAHYSFHAVCDSVEKFLDLLSNVWVRLNRYRFWHTSGEFDESAFYVLHKCLDVLCKLIAPIAPFISEYIWKSLNEDNDSVHLEDFPKPVDLCDDHSLIERVENFLDFLQEGRNLRGHLGIKIRQPLPVMNIPVKLGEELEWYLCQELNVKSIAYNELSYETELTDDLITEGWAREFGHFVQNLRKSLNFEVKDRIILTTDLSLDLGKHREDVEEKCLIVDWQNGVGSHQGQIEDTSFTVSLEKV